MGIGPQTGHLDLEPLTAAHTAELPTSPDDASLHQFTCGTPLSAGALTARYQRLATFPARQ